jgi:hypothetical protein
MDIPFKPKRSLINDVKAAVADSLPDSDELSRNLRLRFLNTVVRPARRVSNSDAVSFAEKQIDQTLARVFREALQAAGLKSCTSDNTYGQLHYYDSHPQSQEPPIVMIHGIGSSGQCFAILALMLMNKRLSLIHI